MDALCGALIGGCGNIDLSVCCSSLQETCGSCCSCCSGGFCFLWLGNTSHRECNCFFKTIINLVAYGVCGALIIAGMGLLAKDHTDPILRSNGIGMIAVGVVLAAIWTFLVCKFCRYREAKNGKDIERKEEKETLLNQRRLDSTSNILDTLMMQAGPPLHD